MELRLIFMSWVLKKPEKTTQILFSSVTEIGREYNRPIHAPHKLVRISKEVVSSILDQELTHGD